MPEPALAGKYNMNNHVINGKMLIWTVSILSVQRPSIHPSGDWRGRVGGVLKLKRRERSDRISGLNFSSDDDDDLTIRSYGPTTSSLMSLALSKYYNGTAANNATVPTFSHGNIWGG